jgi:hypothetical protein
MTGKGRCWARTTSGCATKALPTPTRNSRRLMTTSRESGPCSKGSVKHAGTGATSSPSTAPSCLRDSRQSWPLHGVMLMRSPLARERRSPPGFIRPAQPVLADRPPAGPGWSFEIKHDGFRIVSRKDGDGLRLWSRNARDWSVEFRAIAEALKALPVSGVILDGEAVAHCDKGLPDFHGLLGDGAASACFYAFDLLAVDARLTTEMPSTIRKVATAMTGIAPVRPSVGVPKQPRARALWVLARFGFQAGLRSQAWLPRHLA